MTKRKYNTGVEDFKEIVDNKDFFVDKTLLIKEFIEDGFKVLLLPRPRRFGKTLNVSMLKYFFDMKEDSKELFKDFKINEDRESLKHMNKYPVISVSFKDASAENWEKAKKNIARIIAKEFIRHKEDVKEILNEIELRDYEAIEREEAREEVLETSLKDLSIYLERKHKKKVIILIDEYDNVIYNMYDKEGFDSCLDLFKVIYGSALKGNISLHKALLTGIMKVAKQSILSSLNNLSVYGLNKKKYSGYFGFLAEEIEPIIEEENLSLQEAKEWYNGYNFRGKTIYNPWSVIKYLDDRETGSYWKDTGGDDLIGPLIKRGGPEVKYMLEEMLAGNSVELEVRENINLRKLSLIDIYSILLQTGYLTYEDEDLKKYKLPNKEVRDFIEGLVKEIDEIIIGNLTELEIMFNDKDWDLLKETLEDSLMEAMSYYDRSKDRREDFYHALLLATFMRFKNWKVRSNREEGLGRPDLILEKGDEKIVIEIKAGRGEKASLDKLIERAEEQIEKKKYGKKAIKIAMAFIGKEFDMKVL